MPWEAVTNQSLTRICEMSHTAKLAPIAVFHPHRRAAKNANGVKKEKQIYIGRMSINGGRKNRKADPTTAASGFFKY